MKISKLLLASLAPIALLAVTGCNKKATADQLEVVEKAFKTLCVSETIGGNPVSINAPMDIKGEENCALELTKTKPVKASSGEKLTVTMEYSFDASYNDVVKEVLAKDPEHDLIKFNYGHIDTDLEGNIIPDSFRVTEFKLKAKAICGPATCEKEFVINLQHNKAIYDAKTIADVYAIHPAGGRYAFQEIDETTGKTYIAGNHGQNFNYIAIKGKLEYVAPDYNWGLFSDGEKMMELYRLDLSTDKNILEVGKYYTMYGEIAQYKGNVQVSYISYIEDLADHSAVADRVDYGELPAGINNSASPQFTHYYEGINNRYGKLTSVTVKTETSEFSSFASGARFTFEVTKDDETFTIAYDYHIAANDNESGLNVAQRIAGLHKGDTITIKGTIRYASDDLNDNGEWQLIPMVAGDIA